MDFDAGYSDSYQPTVGSGMSATPHHDAGQVDKEERGSQPLYKTGRYGEERGRRDEYEERGRFGDEHDRRDDRRDERRDDRRDDRRDRDRDRDDRRRRSRDRDDGYAGGRDNRGRREGRSRSPGRYDRRDDERRDRHYEPAFNKTIHVKGLPMLSGAESVLETLKTVEMYIGKPRECQMVQQDSNSRDQRRTCFVEMPTAEAARMLLSYGTLVVDGVTAELSQPTRPLTKEDLRRDWICTKCGTMNFSRRMECFQCNAPREGNAQPVDESGHRGAAQGLNNDNVVIARDLSDHVDEGSLRRLFQTYGQVREVRLVRDQFSPGRGFAFIEFDRHSEALSVVEDSSRRGVFLDGSRVPCEIARGKDAPSKANHGQALGAIEAAMGLNHGKAPSRDQRSSRDRAERDATAIYGHPPAEGFELDPKTGHFYNAKTEQYYESATGFYYCFKYASLSAMHRLWRACNRTINSELRDGFAIQRIAVLLL